MRSGGMIAVGLNILLYADREDSAWRLAVFSCLMRETSEFAPGFFPVKSFLASAAKYAVRAEFRGPVRVPDRE